MRYIVVISCIFLVGCNIMQNDNLVKTDECNSNSTKNIEKVIINSHPIPPDGYKRPIVDINKLKKSK